MKRVLVTGASGFIGKAVVNALRGHADEIHTVHNTARQMTDSRNHTANLLDPAQIDRLMERIKPTHLIHLAWCAEHGKYWTSPLNLDWVAASLKLFQSFANNGGQRAVFAGTCAEYDWSINTPLFNEETSPSNPATLYGTCKNSLRMVIEKFAGQVNIPTAWGRIFLLYGPGEHSNRLVPSIINPLLNDQPAIVRSGAHVRNLMHVDDVAAAFVHVMDTNAIGIVNIAHPQAHSLGEVARMIGELTGKNRLVQVEEAAGTIGNPLNLVADVSKLTSLGFNPTHSLRKGLATLVRS